MYEHITFEGILGRMLDRVPDTLDKREGSVIYDALAPAAIELQNMYIELDVILDETFADTASRDYLIKRTAERGIVPHHATKAILRGEFDPDTLEIPIGSRFSSGGHNYVVKGKDAESGCRLQCETLGTEGNKVFGALIPIEYIDGLQTAKLTKLLIPAEDEEETEHLRERYFATLDVQAFGGNIADYKAKVSGLSGVGGVKVYPTWNGGGTVKLVIIDSRWKKPSGELVDFVQTEIDPEQNHGEGEGLAPIGHVVTVMGVQEKPVDVYTNVTLRPGMRWPDIKPFIEQAVDEYFADLSGGWARESELVVRISQMESRFLSVDGVIDVSGTHLNGDFGNIILSSEEIPVRGDLDGQAAN